MSKIRFGCPFCGADPTQGDNILGEKDDGTTCMNCYAPLLHDKKMAALVSRSPSFDRLMQKAEEHEDDPEKEARYVDAAIMLFPDEPRGWMKKAKLLAGERNSYIMGEALVKFIEKTDENDLRPMYPDIVSMISEEIVNCAYTNSDYCDFSDVNDAFVAKLGRDFSFNEELFSRIEGCLSSDMGEKEFTNMAYSMQNLAFARIADETAKKSIPGLFTSYYNRFIDIAKMFQECKRSKSSVSIINSIPGVFDHMARRAEDRLKCCTGKKEKATVSEMRNKLLEISLTYDEVAMNEGNQDYLDSDVDDYLSAAIGREKPSEDPLNDIRSCFAESKWFKLERTAEEVPKDLKAIAKFYTGCARMMNFRDEDAFDLWKESALEMPEEYRYEAYGAFLTVLKDYYADIPEDEKDLSNDIAEVYLDLGCSPERFVLDELLDFMLGNKLRKRNGTSQMYAMLSMFETFLTFEANPQNHAHYVTRILNYVEKYGPKLRKDERRWLAESTEWMVDLECEIVPRVQEIGSEGCMKVGDRWADDTESFDQLQEGLWDACLMIQDGKHKKAARKIKEYVEAYLSD